MAKFEIFKGVNSIKFNQRFKDDNACLDYLSELKWEEGYRCKKCGNDKFCIGKKAHNRRCTKCRYDESPTVGTMFEKLKFPILVAFHIAFKISTKKKGMSSLELSHEFELRQKTCWEFKLKVQKAMASSLKHPLSGIIHVDEFMVGGEEQGKKGRSKGLKKMIVLAIEIVEGGVGRAYAEIIEHASAKELGTFLRKYVSKEAHVITDEWRGYIPLKKEFVNLKQVPSDEGKNFKDLHVHIMNIKGWLRGIHHHCSKERMQNYLDEYHFRYNRRGNMETIFNVLMKRMIKKPTKYRIIRQLQLRPKRLYQYKLKQTEKSVFFCLQQIVLLNLQKTNTNLMKKLITTSFALLCALSSAQINLTPDSNFGNNGTVNLAPNLTKFLSFHFLNDKIMVQNIDYSNPDLLGSRITMLSGNGNLDTSFGANGSFFLDSSSDFVHYIDGNQLLFFSGKKYLHNGTLDATYGNNGQSQTFSDELYRKVLSNGKLLVRTENNFYQFDQSGNLDLTFGNNGIVNAYNSNFPGSLIPNFKTNTSFFSLYNTSVLEYNFNNSMLRKVNVDSGNYDISYGMSGNGQYFNGTSATIMKFQPLNDGTIISYLFDRNDTSSNYLTKTLSTGLLDNNFGINGKIDLPNNINGNSLLYNQDFVVYHQTNYIIPVLDQNYPKKIYLSSFNNSGLSTINSQSLLDTGITTEMVNPDDKIFVSVKDNYLYLFVTPNLIKRYLISESVLSANENSLKEIYNFNNPFQDELKISTNENIKSTEFYDNSGRLVLKNMGSKNINTSSLERGVYIIVVTSSNNKIFSKKVIKN